MQLNDFMTGSVCEPVRSIYVGQDSRFIVSMVVSYNATEATSPEQAAAAALALVSDNKSGDTTWHVFDRAESKHYWLQQHEFEELMYTRGMMRS